MTERRLKLITGPFQSTGTHTEKTSVGPQRWPDVVRGVAQRLNATISTPELQQVSARNAVWLCWNPNLALCANSVSNKNSVYLFWGVTESNGFQHQIANLRLKWILKRAGSICVNDRISADDVGRLVGRKAHLIPYVVDSDFFRPAPGTRDTTIVVPGNNDRDEDFVTTLASQGRSIIRVTSSPKIRDHYMKRGLQSILRYRVTFTELRDLYQRSGMVVFPISNPNHAAGQTAVLEALACGAPIIITSGRTATIVEDYPGVRVTTPEALLETVERSALEAPLDHTFKQHAVISARHSVPVCVDALLHQILTVAEKNQIRMFPARNAA